jgi:hypothetical protein
MQISFPSEHPIYCGIDPALSFPALVEGRRVHCAITAAALEDHFRAASPRERVRYASATPVTMLSVTACRAASLAR